jgi:hypothetical protein
MSYLGIQVIWKTSLLFLSSFKERDFEFSLLPRLEADFWWTFPHNANSQMSYELMK